MSDHLKVEFGGGGSQPGSDWVVHRTEHDCDITSLPLPYVNDTVSHIRAEHVCEHITPPQFLRFLQDCHRILVPGGQLRICMPVLDRLEGDHARDIITGHGHLGAYLTPLIETFIRLAGFAHVEESPLHYTDHHWKEITKEKDELETARFVAIK